MARTAFSIPPRAADAGKKPLLEVSDLKTYFYTEEGEIRAVDGVSFQLARGRTLALVGESGCGKSVTAYSLLRLIHPPGRIMGGSVRLYGSGDAPPLDVLALDESSEELYDVRGGRAAIVFQEASAALSPVHTVGSQMVEAIRLHQKITRRGAARMATDLLESVGIKSPRLCFSQYPHELSGGMRQRVMIAMALAADPDLLIADEPTTALDVTIQAQVLDLMEQLRERTGMGILLITHDLGVVSRLADEVAVMYLGRIVERAPVKSIIQRPRHPYTIGLLDSLPSLTPVGQRLPSVRGSVPALSEIPPGCPFHPRCEFAVMGRCNIGAPPPLERIVVPGAADGVEHFAACWRVREVALERLLRRPLEADQEELAAMQAAEAEGDAAAEAGVSAAASGAGAALEGEGPISDPALTPTSLAEAAWFAEGERLSLPPEEEESS